LEVIEVPSENKVTLPVGMHGELGATVTVKEMICPYTAGFAFEDALVAVLAWFICKVKPSVPEFALESVTITMKLKLPAVHGVPESTPPELPDMPVGRAPLKFHKSDPVPPCWVN
jgi:hypothetical protein